jgi:UDP-glucose:(heptosyl)LPS alpha-1,3-glucosyltransferase
MKIAFVVHDFLLGTGHGRYCIELARRFAREHEVHVLANQFENGLNFPFQQHRVSALRFSALATVLSFPGAADKILARERFDVVHAQGYSSTQADVITAHVCNAARYKISPARKWQKKLFPALVIPRERNFYELAANAKIITVSKVLQRELQVEYGASSTVIYHGVDVDFLQPGENQNANQWLFVGEAVKGLRQAIEALKDFPASKLKVVTRSNVHEYRAFAQLIGVVDQVDFQGLTNDLRPVYQSAGLFIYPSDYDAFGMVVAEAMATGLAVVVGSDIGAAEWIEDGRNGFLCDPRDAASIRAAIKRAQSSDGEVGKNARRTAQLHTWDHCAAQTMDVYQRAMASKRASK